MKLIVFTDLDGTLLDQDDYSYQAAVPILKELKERQVPVIPVTSKTRQEVEALRQRLSLTDPFIVENGSGVFIPSPHNLTISEHSYRLGCTYTQARVGLQAISAALSIDLRGFGDLATEELVKLTGLTVAEAQRAKAREFSEPFVTPNVASEQLEQTAHGQGLRVLVGDRFSHLIGKEAGKGRAVRWLVQQYSADVITVGLGNSPNDIEMLAAVDLPIVVPGRNGPHPDLAQQGWNIAPAPGSEGWAQAVTQLLRSLSSTSSN